MTLLIQPKNTDEKEKPKETLKEKAAGFQFQLPAAGTKSKTASDSQPAKQSGIKLGNTTNKQNNNGLQIGKPKAQTVETESVTIPEMSDDKYKMVVGDSEEFSQEAVDRFQEQLNKLAAAVDTGKGDLKNEMQNILVFLDDNPQYKENVSAKDVAVFVRACRKVAGITVTEKAAKQTKKKKSDTVVNDLMDELADFDLEL